MDRQKRTALQRRHLTSPLAPAPLTDVFISYARVDEPIAARVAESLRSEGFDVWFDESIYAGAEWEKLLTNTLASAKAVLVLWSKRSVRRKWVLKEAGIALATNRLVPAQIDNCRIPSGFDSCQTAIMPGWNGTPRHPEWSRLLAGLARLAPPSRIDNVRPGFDTGFLGINLDLPAISGVGEEFRYLHFSVVMNPMRRLAWYVAFNLKPPTRIRRVEKFMPDPMLPATFQPSDVQFFRSGMDRAHLVRVASVSWGDEREARIASQQAFFWTNTAPQHRVISRHVWYKVGQWEEQLVRKAGNVSGFAGPVLAPNDPLHGEAEQMLGRLRVRQNFRLPRRFWKVLALAGTGQRLETAAFMVDQSSFLEEWTAKGQESIVANAPTIDEPTVTEEPSPRQSGVAAFCTSVAEIEKQTGLDFGEKLRNAAPIQD